ncbi:MAG: hypothetical protein Q7S21_01405 [archaeon]|nr:hypothetical protein [archaeon]
MNYKIAIIGLIVLVLIGTAAAYLITFNKAQSTQTDDSRIIKMIPMEKTNQTASFDLIWSGKTSDSKANFIPMFIPMEKKSQVHDIISFGCIVTNKVQAPLL